MTSKLELQIHLALQQIKALKENDLAHINQRLTKLEVNQRWQMALLFVILSAIVGVAVADRLI
jgi:hypothetical protein